MNPSLINFIDESALVGDGTKIWHFAVVLADVVIGEQCSIGSRVEIGQGSRIGKFTRISSGVFLPPNSTIGERAFIGPNCTFTDDRYPRAGNAEYRAEPPTLMDGCSVGAGSVILPGVTIGRKALIGAGSVITKDVPDGAVVRGEPARLRHMTNFEIYAEPIRSELMESHLLPI